MPIVAQYQSKKWYNRFRNGNSFGDNTSDTTPNMRANPHEKTLFVGELIIYQKIDIDDYFVDLDTSSGSFIGKKFSIKSDGSDFTELSVGDEITLLWQAGNELRGTVTSVSKTLIFCDDAQGNPLTDADNDINNGLSHDGTDFIVVRTPITYLNYKWGFSDSSGSPNVSSKLDGQTNSFEIVDINGTSKEAIKKVINQNDDRLFVRKLGNVAIPEKFLNQSNLAQRFEIKHEFFLDDYSEDDIDDIENSNIPDRYLGEITQKYYADLEFRTQKSAPETIKRFTYLDDSDNGWYDESQNGGVNNFTVSNVTVERLSTGDEIEGVSSTDITKVSLRVDSDVNVFGGGIRYFVNHKTLLLGSEYRFKKIAFEPLFDFDSVRNTGTGSISSTIIKNAQASNVSDFGADISFELDLGKNYEDTKYITSLTIGDMRLDNKSRNVVTIPIDIGTYYNAFDVEGLIGNATMEMFQRDCDPYNNTGVSSFSMIQAELVYTKLLLPINAGVIDSIHLETYSVEGGNIDPVDTLEIDTSTFVMVNGVQEIQEDLPTRYSSGFDGRVIKVSNGLYEIIYPYRLPFEKLRAVSGLSDTLFDQLEPNKGKNESVLYQQSKGLKIHVGYRIGMLAEGRITYYRFKTKNPITVLDFETAL